MVSEFYDHGVDMASEIPTSEKSDGFNVYWEANFPDGTAAEKRAARKEYNRGWKDYKSGDYEYESPGPPLWLLVLGLVGVVWWFKR